MLNKTHLTRLASYKMPYGKYKDWSLCDIPEEYLLWMNKKGFPENELGELLQVMLELHIHGLSHLVKELKRRTKQSRY
jgi:uncharacterized protein